MRWISALAAVGLILMAQSSAFALEFEDTSGWARVDARYCTLWFDSGINIKKVNKQIHTRRLRDWRGMPKGTSPEDELASKCDVIFRRAQEVLDMYPPGVHVTLKVTSNRDAIRRVHEKYYGRGTDAVAIYLFENNTIYASVGDLSESVLAHEMAHCIIDHYFQVRPPRKIEELLAMHVDAQLGES